MFTVIIIEICTLILNIRFIKMCLRLDSSETLLKLRILSLGKRIYMQNITKIIPRGSRCFRNSFMNIFVMILFKDKTLEKES